MSTKCEACGKTAYPLESINAVNKVWHKVCFKCAVCSITLNAKTFKGHEGKVYCETHTPKASHTQVADSILTKQALNAPKKGVESGVHKGDARTAPAPSGSVLGSEHGSTTHTEEAPAEEMPPEEN